MTPHSLSGARAGLAYGVVYSPDFGHSTEAVMVVNCGWGGVVVRPGRLDGDEDQTSVLLGVRREGGGEAAPGRGRCLVVVRRRPGGNMC